MGYRSDVVCLIYGELPLMAKYEAEVMQGNAGWQEFKGDSKLFVRDYFHNDYGYQYTDGDKVKLHIRVMELDYYKWYPEDEEVQAWMEMLDRCGDYGISYEFYRVGEEFDDVEIQTGGFKVRYFGEIVRKITIPLIDMRAHDE